MKLPERHFPVRWYGSVRVPFAPSTLAGRIAVAMKLRPGPLHGLAVFLLILLALPAVAAEPSPQNLVGIWRAKRRFGPEVYGALDIRRRADLWAAEIAGLHVPVHVDGEHLTFELSGSQGSFRGRRLGNRVVGHWIQPKTTSNSTAYHYSACLDD
jgi:hypothetical protein